MKALYSKVFYFQKSWTLNNKLSAGFYGSDHCPVTLELSSETSESIVTDGA